MSNSIHISRISKKYGAKVALSGIDLTISPGDCVALVGLNGAGKSTFIRLLAGIDHPDTGSIGIMPSCAIGYMPDHISFSSGVTGREWLRFLCKLKGSPKEHVRVVLAETGLEQVADEKVSSYSRGIVQRLLFAQMLLNDPSLLIMDEPESGLDPFWVKEWKQHIASFRKRGKTVIFSSHHLRDALESSSRIIIFSNGGIISDTAPAAWLSVSDPESFFFDRISAGV